MYTYYIPMRLLIKKYFRNFFSRMKLKPVDINIILLSNTKKVVILTWHSIGHLAAWYGQSTSFINGKTSLTSGSLGTICDGSPSAFKSTWLLLNVRLSKLFKNVPFKIKQNVRDLEWQKLNVLRLNNTYKNIIVFFLGAKI